MPKQSDHRITIRLKPDEYALLQAKAGNNPLSSFLRSLALENAAGRRNAPKAAPIKDHAALAKVLACLGQHRLVHAFKSVQREIKNGIRPTDDDAITLLQECRDLLAKIHKLLMRALGVAER